MNIKSAKERQKAVVLDAMGVLYAVGDDVRDLLCPFIAEKGGSTDTRKIEELYRITSLGQMASREFWQKVGISPGLEDEYLERFRLIDGLLDFLEESKQRGQPVFCLSNDVSEWSKKLRQRFSLDKYIADFIISGDVGMRKPDPAVYRLLLERLNRPAESIVFLDDKVGNLDPAAALGIETILFRSSLFRPADLNPVKNTHPVAANFEQVRQMIGQ